MEQSKLIELLKTFKSKEWRRLGEFVQSPFFNKNQEIAAFYRVLDGYFPHFSPSKIQKEKVFSVLFPGSPFDGQKMGRLMNYLHQLAEQFIVFQYYQEQEILQHYHATLAFSNRKLEKHYNHHYRKMQKQLEKEQQQGASSFHLRYLAAQAATEHFSQRKVRMADPSLQQAADALDNYYLLHKLKYTCEMLSRQTIFQVDYQVNYLDELERILESRPQLPPVIDLYYQVMQTFRFPEQAAYFENFLALLRARGQGQTH